MNLRATTNNDENALINQNILLEILRNSHETLIALDVNGNVTYWNEGAEELFQYTREEALGKLFPLIQNKNSYELLTILSSSKELKSLNYRTIKTNKLGSELDLIFQTIPIVRDNTLYGTAIRVHKTEILKKVGYLPVNIDVKQKEQKRTFHVIRDLILLTLEKDKKTINQLANESGINWRTVEKHLTYLIGKKLVAEIFSSEYVRIFELTELGKLYSKKLKHELN